MYDAEMFALVWDIEFHLFLTYRAVPLSPPGGVGICGHEYVEPPGEERVNSLANYPLFSFMGVEILPTSGISTSAKYPRPPAEYPLISFMGGGACTETVHVMERDYKQSKHNRK